MKRLIAMSVMAVALCACSTAKKVSADYENVIPLPQEITVVHEPFYYKKEYTHSLSGRGCFIEKECGVSCRLYKGIDRKATVS